MNWPLRREGYGTLFCTIFITQKMFAGPRIRFNGRTAISANRQFFMQPSRPPHLEATANQSPKLASRVAVFAFGGGGGREEALNPRSSLCQQNAPIFHSRCAISITMKTRDRARTTQCETEMVGSKIKSLVDPNFSV